MSFHANCQLVTTIKQTDGYLSHKATNSYSCSLLDPHSLLHSTPTRSRVLRRIQLENYIVTLYILISRNHSCSLSAPKTTYFVLHLQQPFFVAFFIPYHTLPTCLFWGEGAVNLLKVSKAARFFFPLHLLLCLPIFD